MYAQFERFAIRMKLSQARAASHQGDCQADLLALSLFPDIRTQLIKIGPAVIRAELREYGAWDEEELRDDDQNRIRILWLAAGNIVDEAHESKRR
jgi:hypothetical protein